MTERPEPDLDHVREALREHDERVQENEREAPAEPPPESEPEPDEPGGD